MLAKRLKQRGVCVALLLCFLPLTSIPASESGGMRGIIVEAIGDNFTTHKKSVTLVSDTKHYNFDTLMIQVRRNGEAYYRSVTEPFVISSPGIGYSDPDNNDPLKDIIEINKDQPPYLEVYAMFETLKTHTGFKNPIPGNIALEQPRWINVNSQGNKVASSGDIFLDPGIPEVRDFVVGVIMEVVQKYDIDGIFLTGLSNPEGNDNWGYSRGAVRIFNKQHGRSGTPERDDPMWTNWRRENLTKLIEQIHDEVKAVKPDVKIIVATIAKGKSPANDLEFNDTVAYEQYFQDWLTWCKKGYIDYNCLLNFRNNIREKDAEEFQKWCAFGAKFRYKAYLMMGIGGFTNFPSEVLNQIRHITTAGITDNFVIFHSDKISLGNQDRLYITLKTFFNQLKKLKDVEMIVAQNAENEIPAETTSTDEQDEQAIPAKKEFELLSPEQLPVPEALPPNTVISPPPDRLLPLSSSLGEKIEKDYLSAFNEWDTIILNNGNSIEGKIKEKGEKTTVILLSSGAEITVKTSDIKGVEEKGNRE